MPAPEKATIGDLLGLLESIQTGLATRATDPKTKRTLAAIARRSAQIAQRLAKPTAQSWQGFLDVVLGRDDGDQVKEFLFGGDSGYEIESISFLEIMRKTVLEFTEAKHV